MKKTKGQACSQIFSHGFYLVMYVDCLALWKTTAKKKQDNEQLLAIQSQLKFCIIITISCDTFNTNVLTSV